MLSDEEKEAIEWLKKADWFSARLYSPTILNLIDKQSKEIEEYKKQLDLDYVDKHFVPIERYYQLEKEIEELEKNRKVSQNFAKIVATDYISKDKIKAKIEEVNKIIDGDKDFINQFQNSVDANVINWYYQKVDLNVRIRNILESLLEKEEK